MPVDVDVVVVVVVRSGGVVVGVVQLSKRNVSQGRMSR